MHRLQGASIALIAVAVVGVALCAGSAAAQSDDRVVLEMEVTTLGGDPVGNASVTAVWDDNETSDRTLVDGVARMEVPSDEDLTIRITHREYIRNHPIEVEDYDGDKLDAILYDRAETTINVTDSEGPLQNATVRMWKRSSDRLAAEGTTDTDGIFETPVIEAGDYNVRITRPGYTSVRTELSINGADSQAIQLNSDSVDLEVRSRDPILNESIGAEVRVFSGNTTVRTAQTTADRGTLTLSLPVNTDYTLSVTKDGYATVNRSLDIEEDDREVNVNMTRLPQLQVTPNNDDIVINQTLGVSVTDEYERPVEGATVTLGEESVTTGEAGEVTLNVTTAGQYNLTAEKGDQTAGPVSITVVDPTSSGVGGQFWLVALGAGIAVVGIVAILVLIRGREL